jgi:hypothetical protein
MPCAPLPAIGFLLGLIAASRYPASSQPVRASRWPSHIASSDQRTSGAAKSAMAGRAPPKELGVQARGGRQLRRKALVAGRWPTRSVIRTTRSCGTANICNGSVRFVLVGSFAGCYKRFREEDPLGFHDPTHALFNSFHL